MNLFKVTYKRGLGTPITVEAETTGDAAKAGLAEYRRTNGTDEMVDFSTVEKVIESVKLIIN